MNNLEISQLPQHEWVEYKRQNRDKLLNKYPNYVSSIQGVGLLAAVIFKNSNGEPLSKLCDLISEKCLQTGLLVVHTGRESIKLAPPLVIKEEELNEGVETFIDAVENSINELYGS